MTTNRKEILDPALIRPGRADVHVLFDYATAEQAARMFRAWFPDANSGWAALFGLAVESRRMSMAEVQAHLLLHKDSAREAAVLPALSEMPAIEVAEPERATA
jgi:chaperone BCS1